MGRYDRLQLAAVVTGGLAVIATFLPYYGLAAPDGLFGRPLDATITAWHSYAIVGCLLVLAATLVAAFRAFAPERWPAEVPVAPYVLTAGLAGLGALLLILRLATWQRHELLGLSIGPRWGGYLLCLLAVAQAVLAGLASRAAGESLPRPSSAPLAPPPASPPAPPPA